MPETDGSRSAAVEDGVQKLERRLTGVRLQSTRALRDLHRLMSRDLRAERRRAARVERRLTESRERAKRLREAVRRARARAERAERELEQLRTTVQAGSASARARRLAGRAVDRLGLRRRGPR